MNLQCGPYLPNPVADRNDKLDVLTYKLVEIASESSNNETLIPRRNLLYFRNLSD